MNLLNKKIFDSGERYFSVDLSDLSVKIIQLEKNGQVDAVRSYFSTDIERGYIEDGTIIEKNKVIELLRAAKNKAGPKKINTDKVICSLPESKVFLRIINIPKMNEEEAAEAVKWEIEASIPLSVDQVYYDWQFLDVDGGKQNVLTVAVAKEIVDDTMEVMAGAGMDVYGLEVESIASARSLIKSDATSENVTLIVDLGAQKTSFIITQGSVPFFTSSIPFSSDGIDDVIAKELSISGDEAKKIKITRGIDQYGGGQSLFRPISPLLEHLVKEIEKSIDFYENLSKGSGVQKIVLCGGGANLKGLLPYLVSRLSKEIMVGDPWINLNLGENLPIISKEESVGYTTAIGLALKKINRWKSN